MTIRDSRNRSRRRGYARAALIALGLTLGEPSRGLTQGIHDLDVRIRPERDTTVVGDTLYAYFEVRNSTSKPIRAVLPFRENHWMVLLMNTERQAFLLNGYIGLVAVPDPELQCTLPAHGSVGWRVFVGLIDAPPGRYHLVGTVKVGVLEGPAYVLLTDSAQVAVRQR